MGHLHVLFAPGALLYLCARARVGRLITLISYCALAPQVIFYLDPPSSCVPPASISTETPTQSDTPQPLWRSRNMGSAARHLCSGLLVVFLLGLHHSSSFWIVNVVFPPNAKPRVSSNSTPPLIIGKWFICMSN